MAANNIKAYNVPNVVIAKDRAFASVLDKLRANSQPLSRREGQTQTYAETYAMVRSKMLSASSRNCYAAPWIGSCAEFSIP
jgi:hypothetical protein